jgi:hypothetical protein
MRRAVEDRTMARRLILGALLTVCAAAPVGAVTPTPEPAQLAEGWFDATERFDALLTYEITRGPLRAVFTISRRWRGDEAELLFDVREPTQFGDWALLVRQNRGAADDLFAYLGSTTGRRVRRLSAPVLEREALYQILALADFRPTARGELVYEAGPDESLAGTPCHVVVARPRRAVLGFDKVELAFAADTRLLLESRFFRGKREFRRLTTTPADFADFDGHRLPVRRIAKSWADSGETALLLKNALPTSDLPDELFSHRNLLVQRFPDF